MYVYAYLVAIASVLKYGVRNEPKHVLVELSVSKSQVSFLAVLLLI